MYLSFDLSIHLSIYLSVCLSVCLFLFIYPTICLRIYPSQSFCTQSRALSGTSSSKPRCPTSFDPGRFATWLVWKITVRQDRYESLQDRSHLGIKARSQENGHTAVCFVPSEKTDTQATRPDDICTATQYCAFGCQKKPNTEGCKRKWKQWLGKTWNDLSSESILSECCASLHVSPSFTQVMRSSARKSSMV